MTNQQNDCAPSEDSCQPGHPPSLIRVFAVRWTQAFFTRTAKTLIRLGGCPCWSESSLGAHSFCWFVMSRLTCVWMGKPSQTYFMHQPWTSLVRCSGIHKQNAERVGPPVASLPGMRTVTSSIFTSGKTFFLRDLVMKKNCTTILSLPLNQEGQLSVSGERTGTKYW